MTRSDNDEGLVAALVRLLDQRYRFREDPARESELKRTHVELRELLRQLADENEPSKAVP